eukprot:366505-Chlamydomonas_euryale.AAC.14
MPHSLDEGVRRTYDGGIGDSWGGGVRHAVRVKGFTRGRSEACTKGLGSETCILVGYPRQKKGGCAHATRKKSKSDPATSTPGRALESSRVLNCN